LFGAYFYMNLKLRTVWREVKKTQKAKKNMWLRKHKIFILSLLTENVCWSVTKKWRLIYLNIYHFYFHEACLKEVVELGSNST
jgi:hypothetical protein